MITKNDVCLPQGIILIEHTSVSRILSPIFLSHGYSAEVAESLTSESFTALALASLQVNECPVYQFLVLMIKEKTFHL